jgi:membrane protein DedA with SNARE-associated domain
VAFWQLLLVEEAATLFGSSLLFAFTHRFGRALLQNYGRLIHLGPEELARAEARVVRYGLVAIAVARVIPGLRIVTVVAAGVLGVPYRVFAPAVAVGGFVYLLVYTSLGYFVGPVVLSFIRQIGLPISALVSLAAVAGIVVAVHVMGRAAGGERQRPTPASGMFAGIVAGITALLATNGIYGLTTWAAQAFRLRALVTPTLASGLQFVIGWPAFLVLAVVAGGVLSLPLVLRIPSVVRYLLVLGPPIAVAMLLIDPLMEDARNAVAGRGAIPLVAFTVLRLAIYSAAVIRFMPLFARVRVAGFALGEDEGTPEEVPVAPAPQTLEAATVPEAPESPAVAVDNESGPSAPLRRAR